MQRLVRLMAWSHAITRTTIGAVLLLDAGGLARGWLGDDVRRGGGRAALRMFGVRDLLIGIGLLRLLATRRPVRLWFGLGVLLELADGTATLLDRDQLPAGAAPDGWALLAGAGAIGGGLVALLIDE